MASSKSAYDTAMKTRAILVERFPACFMGEKQSKLPLKIGIYEDVLAAAPELDSKHIKLALRDYCNGLSYLTSTIAGCPRVDLAGAMAGEVSEASARMAEHLRNLHMTIRKVKRENKELRQQLHAQKAA